MRKSIQLMLILSLMVSYLSAQRTITGTVFNEENETLIGASILITGTSTGTITDFDGRFTLDLPAEATSLKISYTGYREMEITISSESNYELTLEEDIIGLEDVIVVGYSPQKRKDLTGAVSSIKSADIENVP